jgi:1-acyl-sn-glycerol-3-phosphate acyltransferase
VSSLKKTANTIFKKIRLITFHVAVLSAQHLGAIFFFIVTRYFLKPSVYGEEGIEKIKGLLNGNIKGKIIVANHISDLDPFFICSMIPFSQRLRLFPVIFLAKQELFATRTGNFSFRLLGCVPVGEGKSFAVRNITKEIKKGRTIFIFPEGTVSADGIVGKDQGAIKFLAHFNSFVLQPVWIEGIKNFREDRRKILTQKGRLLIHFGNPLVVKKGEEINVVEKIKSLKIRESQLMKAHKTGG